jgi:hypothetical protein
MTIDVPFNSIVYPLIREAIETVTGIDLRSKLIIQFLLWFIVTSIRIDDSDDLISCPFNALWESLCVI